MSIAAAFLPYGNTVAVVTNATPSTSSNATVTLYGNGTSFVVNVGSGLRPAAQPNQVRVFNSGSSIVFLSFNLAARTAVIPVAGTPQLEFPILPNSVETFSGIVWNGTPAGPPGIGLPSPTLVVATITTGTSIPLYLTFGEGL